MKSKLNPKLAEGKMRVEISNKKIEKLKKLSCFSEKNQQNWQALKVNEEKQYTTCIRQTHRPVEQHGEPRNKCSCLWLSNLWQNC